MEKVTDKMRVDSLGGGMAKQAAMIKMLRQRQLDAAIAQASGMSYPMQQAPAQNSMPGPAMSQPEFSGYGAARPPQTLQQQVQLQELLRRQQLAPQQ